MKTPVSPVVFVSIIAVALLLFGAFIMKVWFAPSSVPATQAELRSATNPRTGGGPDAEALKYRDEYNKTHPGAAGSR